MTKFHSHHTVPVHKGGKNSPQVLLTVFEHAELHAKRFINGEDDGFHMSLLDFLPEDLDVLVRKRQSDLMKTDRNPGYGTSFVKGRKWFNNGVREVLLFEQPQDFTEGRLPLLEETKQKMSESQTGNRWWNNGTEERQSKQQPEGFSPGRLPGRGNTPKPVELLDTLTGTTLYFESYKQCYTFLEVTKKVFMNRLHKSKLVHSRYLPSVG